MGSDGLGLGLLFSGGAFLFTIAVYVMPELSGGEEGGGKGKGVGEGVEEGGDEEVEGLLHGEHGHSHGGGGEGEGDGAPMEWRLMISLIIGMLSPLLLALNETHSHG